MQRKHEIKYYGGHREHVCIHFIIIWPKSLRWLGLISHLSFKSSLEAASVINSRANLECPSCICRPHLAPNFKFAWFDSLLYSYVCHPVKAKIISLYNHPIFSPFAHSLLIVDAMVSLQAPLSPNNGKANKEFDNLSKKRKLEEIIPGEGTFDKRSSKGVTTKSSIFDIELQLETPLPLEWERCLDIQV